MKIIATIEARMGSSRLPGKVLLPAMGEPMLYWLIKRLKKSRLIDDLIIASSIDQKDDQISDFAKKHSLNFFRGSEDNVMLRVIKAAESLDAELIVQITGDCPLIDPEITDQVIELYLNNITDFASNSIIRTYPDGMDVQVFSLHSIKKSYSLVTSELDREHVSSHMARNNQLFKQLNLKAPKKLFWPDLGLTLDQKEDYKLIKNIFEYFNDLNADFNCFDIIEYLRNNKKLLNINSHVIRKEYS